jgi:hypothetical protein
MATRWYEDLENKLAYPPLYVIKNSQATLPYLPPPRLKVVIWGDTQGQLIDSRTDSAFNRFLEDFRPDIAVLNGDIVDFSSISHFVPSPSETIPLEKELEITREYIKGKVALLPAHCQVHFNEGNHEDRLRKYIYSKAEKLGKLESLDLRTLLGIPPSWTYTHYHNPTVSSPDGSPGIRIHGLLVTHGETVRKWSGATARAYWEHYGGSGVVGHTHRLGAFYRRQGKETYLWLEGGCMCGLEPPYANSPDWQQGFVAGYIWPEEGEQVSRFGLHQVPIVDHKFEWEGRIYQP